jgi:hypothetical protein
MKIALCGSLSFAEEIKRMKDSLNKKRHDILLPHSIEKFTPEDVRAFKNDTKGRKKYFRIAPFFIKKHLDKILNSDAILVINLEKDGVKNYIGGNTFTEIMFAFYHGKEIFLLNPIPKHERLSCITDEIEIVQPIILNGNLDLIK